MRALAYGRVSTDEQADGGHSLDAQREATAREAARRGYDVEWTADAGASGKHINPALREALDHLASGRADALIVARLDRLARSVAHAADILDLARRQGWNLIIADLGLDLSTPQGRALAQTMAVFAELERELISQRTREGLAAARAKGKRIGRPRLAPSAVVDRICSERKAGASFGSIARALTADEVLTPAGRTTWQSSTVRRIYAAATRQEVA